MKKIEKLFENNKKWAMGMKKKNPRFFQKLAHLQKPQFLWIGCSDSRVPANEITGLLPGEVFVHRNIANIVYLNDINCLSVIQYAIDVLKVKHIIVCGHYNCGGVRAVVESQRIKGIDNWLKSIQDIKVKHFQQLAKIKSKIEKVNQLCELNVLKQARNVCQTKFVKNAWKKGRPLTIHAWIYNVGDGLLKELCQFSSAVSK